MRYFLDTEFIEDGRTIDLISIGIVCQDGRQFYRQNHECKFPTASDWVWRNVFPHLAHFDMRGRPSCTGLPSQDSLSNARQAPCGPNCPWRKRHEIRDELKAFLDPAQYGKPEFWGYYSDYDWVAFCQLFGAMVDLPKGFPMYCRDLKQLCVDRGNPELPKPDGEHSAIKDALWNCEMHAMLIAMPSVGAVPKAAAP